MGYCFVDCAECIKTKCPFHPVHDEEVAVRDIMGEMCEKTPSFSRLTWQSDTEMVAISVPHGGLTASAFLEDLIKPLMLAIGYQPQTVSEVLGEDEEGA